VSNRLQISTSSAADRQIIVVRGEVDMESSPQLLAALQAALQQGQAPVVDLQGVSFMDSSGVAVLVQGLRAARKRELDFRLRQPSQKVTAVLKLAQLLQLFTIDDPGARDG
jgi:anti-sigma B factor antagonist